MRPTLIVTVDTEEEGLWGGNYRPDGNTVENVLHVPRFQRLCDRYDVRPTYLIDAPVVADDRCVAVLGEIHAEGRCEIGAHLHSWCNPPLRELAGPAETYLHNLPAVQQRDKLRWLTERIATAFDVPPTSFRAGRYGLDARGLNLLQEMEYRVDSSVIPFTDYSPQGGPDFSQAPCTPYFPDRENLAREAPAGEVLEVPVTVGYWRGSFRKAFHLQQRLRRGIAARMHVEGVLDRVRLVSRIKMSPEQSSAAAMKRLVDRCCELEIPSVVMMFHSSSLLPGASPYVRDEHSLAQFLQRMEAVFEHALHRRCLRAATLTEFGRRFFPPACPIRTTPSREPGATSTEVTSNVHDH